MTGDVRYIMNLLLLQQVDRSQSHPVGRLKACGCWQDELVPGVLLFCCHTLFAYRHALASALNQAVSCHCHTPVLSALLIRQHEGQVDGVEAWHGHRVWLLSTCAYHLAGQHSWGVSTAATFVVEADI